MDSNDLPGLESNSDTDDDSSYCEPPFFDESMRCVCLFCEEAFNCPESTFDHIKDLHGIDFIGTINQLKLDYYAFVKIINYFRKSRINESEAIKVIESRIWEDDQYMKPVLENDTLLTYGRYLIWYH